MYTLCRPTRFYSIAAEDSLRNDGGFLPLGQLGQLAQLERNLDQGLQTLGGRPGVLVRVVAVLFDVHSDGGALGTGTRESEDDSAAVGELDVQSLVLGDGSVDRVGVGEVVGFLDGEADVGRGGLQGGSDKGRVGELLSEVVHHFLGSGFDLLVVVSGEEVSAVLLVVFDQDVVDVLSRLFLVGDGQDGQPG